MNSEEVVKIDALKHHLRQRICDTRSTYRRGRRGTAVKVYTISDESKYLLLHNVPDIRCDIRQELLQLCQPFGPIERLVSTDYPKCEDFSKVFLIQYKHFGNAVKAKKSLDDHSFLGSVLHVCYAPELESIDETREKLEQRRRYVSHVLDTSHQKNSNTNRNQTTIDCKEVPNVLHKNYSQIKDLRIETKRSDSKRKFSEMIDNSSESQIQSNEEPEASKIPKPRPKIRWRLT